MLRDDVPVFQLGTYICHVCYAATAGTEQYTLASMRHLLSQ